MYGLALQRLKECRAKNDIVRFPDVFTKLCTGFSIKKEECWELLFLFRDLGLIEIVCGHGVRVKN
ncbi:MAG: hypothetical protein ABIB71_03160 [Candidatus Woesearchaeota archaeon]